MLKKAWELILLVVLVTIGLNIAYEAISPYLPVVGIGIVVVILTATIWLAVKLVSRRARM